MSESETLLAQAVAAVQQGDFRTAADRFEKIAQILAPVRVADAVSAYESAARLRLMLDDVRRAQANVSRAMKLDPDSVRVLRVHAEVTDKTGEPPARRAAWQAVADVGDADQRREAQLHLAPIARELNEHKVAESHFQAALEDLTPDTDPTMASELWLEIAICRTVQQLFDAADEALAMAEKHLPQPDDSGIPGRITGQRGVIAMGRGDHVKALELAEKSRDDAVSRNDVMTYMSASMLVAAIHEQADRLVDAYDTYVRARESLVQLLGEQAKGMIQPAITVFEERLGKDKFEQVWNAWVAKRKAARGN